MKVLSEALGYSLTRGREGPCELPHDKKTARKGFAEGWSIYPPCPIGAPLDLPEKNEQNQQYVINAVMRWLRWHNRWLLVFDNADDIDAVQSFLPLAYRGHILITTRAYALGQLAHRLDLDKMDQSTGALLLLRRAAIIPPQASLDAVSEQERTIAETIAFILDCVKNSSMQNIHFFECTFLTSPGQDDNTRKMITNFLQGIAPLEAENVAN